MPEHYCNHVRAGGRQGLQITAYLRYGNIQIAGQTSKVRRRSRQEAKRKDAILPSHHKFLIKAGERGENGVSMGNRKKGTKDCVTDWQSYLLKP